MSSSAPSGLRIAVVGPISGGSWSIAAASTRAFRRLGHHTTFINNNHFAPVLAQARALPAQARSQREVEIYMQAAAQTKERLHHLKPQWALYLAQAPVLSANDLAPLRDRGAPAVFWFVEDFRVFTYWKRAAPRFDHVWTIQREPFLQLLGQAGVASTQYVPLACEPLKRRLPVTPDADALTFVGTGYPNRVELLAHLAVPGLKVHGPLFSRDPRLAAHVAHDGVLPHNALAGVFARGGINLNLSSTIDPTKFHERKDFVNPRTFEICGAGGFQLAEALVPLEEFFEPQVEVATFQSVEEARDKIAFYRNHHTQKQAMQAKGRARAWAHHSYEARLQAALESLWARDGDRIAKAKEPEVAGGPRGAAGGGKAQPARGHARNMER